MKKSVLAILLTICAILIFPVYSGYLYNPISAVLFTTTQTPADPMKEDVKMNQLRVMTYNIRHGQGMDERVDLNRIAAVIRSAQVDLVGLNEVDVQMVRSGLIDQSKELGQMLAMQSVFVPAVNYILGQYGNALLTQKPIVEMRQETLPRFLNREQRSLGIFTLRLEEQDVNVLVTHLGLNPVEREEQFRVLAERIKSLEGPVMVLGDFNVIPTAPVVRKFLQDTGLRVHSFVSTFPSSDPDLKIDYILTSDDWEEVHEVEVIATLASDHLPLVGTFRLKRSVSNL